MRNLLFKMFLMIVVVLSVTTTLAQVIDTFPYNESFDDTTFAPTGWANVNTAGTSIPGTWNRAIECIDPEFLPFNGVGMAQFDSYNYDSGTMGILATPSMTLPGNDYQVSFWFYRDEYYNENVDLLNVYFNTSQNLSGTPVLLGSIYRSINMEPIVPLPGWYKYTFAFPAASAGAGKFVILEGYSDYGNSLYVDDFSVKQQPATPGVAELIYPINVETQIGPTPEFAWSAGPGHVPTGYKFSLGTTMAANELVDSQNLGNVLTYTYVDSLIPFTQYFWKVVPYNVAGDGVDIPVWSFTTAGLIEDAIAINPVPADLAAIVNPNVSLRWFFGRNATSYDVYFGTTLPVTVTANVTSKIWNPPTLAFNTTYFWKIVPRNGFGTTTGTPEVWSFTTGPNPLVTSFPYSESFDSELFEPYGWTNLSGSDDIDDPYKWCRTIADYFPTIVPHSGVGLAYYESVTTAPGSTAILATPPLAISSDNYSLSFWMFGEPSCADNHDRVEVSLNSTPTLGGIVLDTIERFNDNVGWFQHTYPLGAATGTRYIIFKAISECGQNMYIDDICIQEAAFLEAPTNLELIPVSSESIRLNWDLVTGATSYRIYKSTDPDVAIIPGTHIAEVSTNTYLDESFTEAEFYKVTAVNNSRQLSITNKLSPYKPVSSKPVKKPKFQQK